MQPVLIIARWIIRGEVQASAFIASQRTTDNQVGDGRNVSKFYETFDHLGTFVEIFDFVPNELDSTLSSLQAKIRPDNTHVIPHGLLDFLPIVLDEHPFFGVERPADIPLTDLWNGSARIPNQGESVLEGPMRKYDRFEKRVARQSIRPVYTRHRDLTTRVQVPD
jgi:hypothetical protein